MLELKIKCREPGCTKNHTWPDINQEGKAVVCLQVRLRSTKHVVEIELPKLDLQPMNYFSDQVEEKAVGKAG